MLAEYPLVTAGYVKEGKHQTSMLGKCYTKLVVYSSLAFIHRSSPRYVTLSIP